MTKVNVVKDIDLIKSIEVYDHAGFAGHGDDIVCAGISTIIFGGLNALIEFGLSEESVEVSEATININLNEVENIQVVVQTIIIQLQTIQESYPDYIDIQIH